MKKKKIIWGIIGCGDVAELKSGPAFNKCENSQLLGVMRRNASKAKDFAKRHCAPFWYDNASKLLENKEINAVYIATPPSTHLEYALLALSKGKDVYLEKPMVLSKKESKLLCKAVKKSNQKLVVAHYRRNLPIYLKIKELLNLNLIGDIEFVDIKYLQSISPNTSDNWRVNPSISGGGYFHDLAPHQLDLMYYFFGDYTIAKGYSMIKDPKFSVPDVVNGVINFNKGIPFSGIWDFSAPEFLHQDKCTIYGSLGSISFPFFENYELTINTNSKTETLNFNNPVNIQHPHIQETVNYFLDKRDNPCSVEEGARIINIIETFSKGIKK